MAIGPSSSGKGNLASVGRGFPWSSNKHGDRSKGPTSVTHGPVAPMQRIRKTLSWYVVCMIVFAQGFLTGSTAQSYFHVMGTSYNCSTNIICLEKAHVYNGSEINSGVQYGMLSLLPEGGYAEGSFSLGVAYYNEPVRLLDLATNQSASFNTSFTINNIQGTNGSFPIPAGDGMAFVISSDSKGIGELSGSSLGIFNSRATTSFKSIVVEFDTYENSGAPVYDINSNHVSFDFANITWAAVANCADVNVVLSQNLTVYAWVEYSRDTKQLEVRISHTNSRPISPLLAYTVDLFDFVEEYMWVGFSSGSFIYYSNFYVGDWTFESYGIIESSTVSTTGTSGVNKVAIIVGICAGIPAVLLGCIVLALLVQRSSASTGERALEESTEEDSLIMQLEGMPKRFTYKQLSVATDGFSEEAKLGRGGFGSVYRGVLPLSGIPVAVKKISGESTQGEKEFMAEVSIISQLRHRNLIQLLGWCKDAAKEQYLLVYELMPNGSLDKVLFAPAGSTDIRSDCLSWPQRFSIVSGTAAGIDYLHQGWTQQVFHRDIKSSNIMLDEEWNAKLGDFGLARLVDHRREATTTLVAGTYGYIAPEVAASGKFTEKSDIFAFGAVVLEVACGRKSLSTQVPEDEKILVNWVWHCLSEGKLLSAVDKRLEEYDKYWMDVLLRVGLLCSHPNPLARPSMRHVVQMLAGDGAVPFIPLSRPDPVFERVGHGNFASHLLDASSKSGLSPSNSGSMSLKSGNSNDSSGPSGKLLRPSLSSKF